MSPDWMRAGAGDRARRSVGAELRGDRTDQWISRRRFAFKGPPDADRMVEVAYGTDAAHRGRGFATEAAAALTEFAFASGRVRLVTAHTVEPETPTSQRVLTKSGFRNVGGGGRSGRRVGVPMERSGTEVNARCGGFAAALIRRQNGDESRCRVSARRWWPENCTTRRSIQLVQARATLPANCFST